jgi:hypothetical protein
MLISITLHYPRGTRDTGGECYSTSKNALYMSFYLCGTERGKRTAVPAD